jgi:hypothetical protein
VLVRSEGEAAETQVWVEHAVKYSYLSRREGIALHKTYDDIIGKLVRMENNPEPWPLQKSQRPVEI